MVTKINSRHCSLANLFLGSQSLVVGTQDSLPDGQGARCVCAGNLSAGVANCIGRDATLFEEIDECNLNSSAQWLGELGLADEICGICVAKHA